MSAKIAEINYPIDNGDYIDDPKKILDEFEDEEMILTKLMEMKYNVNKFVNMRLRQ